MLKSLRLRHDLRLFFRFLIVGIFNTSTAFAIYSIFLKVGFGYQIANLLALIFGIFISFKTQGKFVFNRRENRLLGRFVVAWLFIYLINIIVIGEIIEIVVDPYIAGALAIPISIVASYILQRFFVFRPDRAK